RQLARSHYENFTVASWLLPHSLRPHFYNVYAYCRWADDLADETRDPGRSLTLLDWWENELQACYAGRPHHPVFVALEETIHEFSIPIEPFQSLLVAFRQDQHVHEYATFEALLDYCCHSANPVGRLVLYLGRCHDEPRGALADRVCTGLQLANFWQDVARDYDRGRVYLPRSTREQFGYDDAMLAQRTYNDAFRRAMAFEVTRADGYLRSGLPLVEQVPRRVGADVWLFVQGGLKIMAEVRRLDYDVWTRRPVVTRGQQLGLLCRWLWRAVAWDGTHVRDRSRD
ncbi:MAG TPA: squalene synthase HpnC, partial [Pirellulales bacterium]|nr:squalene synthase HpnC [Pirellulales bacterium]